MVLDFSDDLTSPMVGWLVGWFDGCRLADELTGWLAGWLAGWLVGWLVGWLIFARQVPAPQSTNPRAHGTLHYFAPFADRAALARCWHPALGLEARERRR